MDSPSRVKIKNPLREGLDGLSAGAECSSDRDVTRVALSKFSLDEYLEFDSRPTFVVDLEPGGSTQTKHGRENLRIAYYNPALLAQKQLLDDISGNFLELKVGLSLHTRHAEFKNWVLEKTHTNNSPFLFKDFLWTASTLQEKAHSYRVISGTTINSLWSNHSSEKLDPSGTDKNEDDYMLEPNCLERIFSLNPATLLKHEGANGQSLFRDWTQSEPPSLMSQHLDYARSVDWKRTPLGLMENWEPELRVAANMVMTDVHCAVLFWGSEGTLIYNEKYAGLIEGFHPCMGESVFTALKEHTDHVLPLFNHMKQTGEVIYIEDEPFFLRRNGLIEEAYFCLKFFPVIGKDGKVAGYYQAMSESSNRIILDRRVNTFIDVGSCTSAARSLDDFWPSAVAALGKNPKDVPFALIYTIEDSNHPSSISSTCSNISLQTNKTAVLSGALGVPQNHDAAPQRLKLVDSEDGFAPFFRKAMKNPQLTVLHLEDGSLPAHLVANICSPSFGDAVKSVAIAAISPTGSDQILGFFVLGLNPRYPFDQGSANFITAISRLLAAACCSVVLLEEEVNRREEMIEQAANIQADLSKRLSAHQKRLEVQERRFEQIASRAHVGIFAAAPDGQYTYRNQRWFDIFQIAKNEHLIQHAWSMLVEEEDLKACEHAWLSLSQKLVPISFELRLKRTWEAAKDDSDEPVDTNEHKMWILISAYPELADDGSLKEVIGVVTDISRLKFAEKVQRQHTEEASAHAKALESFIDTTSHEMRNPLSAIMHCADAMLETTNQIVGTCLTKDSISTERRQLWDAVRDSAQTILQCANHQRRIVDDVLTMSKLESGLLIVTPVDVQPSTEIYHALKMFEAEAREAKVHIEDLQIEQGYHENAIDWVLLDPTRVVQIFINLITNAIKFTRFEQERGIKISIDASKTEPAPNSHGVTFFPNSLIQNDFTKQSWPDREVVWIIITVQDTGRGLSISEKNLLFNRFSQASPRTHIQYGGNGLGLFISRRLAELQGGAIGFSSESGRGSTFSFYVKARRTASPPPAPHGGYGLAPTTPASIVPAHAGNSQPQQSNYGQIHILVVEDNLVNQRVLTKQLRRLGCIVDTANHGLEALSYLESTKHWAGSTTNKKELSVVLLDWEMPVMNGINCVKRIRGLQLDGSLKSHIPVIGTTANARGTQIDQAMQAGMDDVVSKPFRVAELMVRIQALLKKIELSK